MGYSREIYDAVQAELERRREAARAEAAALRERVIARHPRAREIEQQMAFAAVEVSRPFWAAGTWRPPWRRSRPAICPCRPSWPP